MDLKAIAMQKIMAKLGGDQNQVSSALSGLFGGGEAQGDQGFNISGLVQKFSGGGLGGALQSWLGDGENENISAEQVTEALGQEQVSAFANKMGINQEEAAGGLSDILPQLIDQGSSGGSLIDSVKGMAAQLLG